MLKKNHTKPAGLYIHIPFCRRKCLYCDFYSVADLSRADDVVAALCQEITLLRADDLAFDTLYIGGGTPSVLGAAKIGRIIEHAMASPWRSIREASTSMT